MTCPKCSGPMLPVYADERLGEYSCTACGKRTFDPWPEDKPQPAETKEVMGKWQYTTCEICGERMRLSTGRTFCSFCMTQLRNWQDGAKTGPAPIIQVDGKWIRNPAWKGKTTRPARMNKAA